MAKTAMKLMFAAMLALLATQAAAPSVRVAAAFEIAWLVQSEVRQQAPRTPRRRTVSATPHRQEPVTYASFAGTEPDVVLAYQLPPPTFSFAL